MRVLLIFSLLCGFAPLAFAQERVGVRTGAHADYSRLVFDWQKRPEYSLSKDGNRILIRFGRAGVPDFGGVKGDAVNVVKVERISTETEPMQIAVTIPAGSRFRDLVVGERVIIDVYNPPASTQLAAPEASPKTAPPTSAAGEKTEAPKTASSTPAATKAAASPPAERAPGETAVGASAAAGANDQAGTAPSGNAASSNTAPSKEGDNPARPAPAVTPPQAGRDNAAAGGIVPAPGAALLPVAEVESDDVPEPAFEPHVITLTSLSSVGLGVFERAGWLWIVVDDPEIKIAPQLAGPQRARFPAIESFDIPGGKAYRLDKPRGLHAYGEGGGMGWRIVLTPQRRDVDTAGAAVDAGRIVWNLRDQRRVLAFQDPAFGDIVTVVTSPQSGQSAGSPRGFVDLTQLESVVGLAYVAHRDDVEATLSPARVSVGRPDGLVLSSADERRAAQIRNAAQEAARSDITPAAPDVPAPETEAAQSAGQTAPDAVPPADAADVRDLNEAANEAPTGANIFNFPRWEMGGRTSLASNMRVIQLDAAGKESAERSEDFITLAKLHVANKRGAEALGFLRMAAQFTPDLQNAPAFRALRGVAAAQMGQHDLAFNDFNLAALRDYDDVKLWRAYTLAELEDWRQAIEAMPPDISLIASYPRDVRTPLALAFAETALRDAKADAAEGILGMVERDLENLPFQEQTAWAYLKGEAARQQGDAARAQEFWEPLVKDGRDHLMRAKAGLSLTQLQIEQKQITPAQAIDRLEGLRYAWRGDELETLINYRLGRVYIDNKDYLKGLSILRNAVSLSPGTELGREITDYMTRSFRTLFANDGLRDVSALDAISLYEEFKELTPAGAEGDRFVERLAERLVDAELLGRAANLLEYQVNHRLQGDKKAEIAIRLAAIRLLDGNPDGALRSLEIAQSVLSGPPRTQPQEQEEENRPQERLSLDSEKQRQINLLRARAHSMKQQPEQAMAILERMRLDPDVNRLRADIAWRAGQWEAASVALNDLMMAEDLSPRRALSPYQAQLILNRAVALNLSGNRVALANLRDRYRGQMGATDRAEAFEVITRPRRPDMVGSREAIERMISELSLFQDFLEAFSRNGDGADGAEAGSGAGADSASEADESAAAREGSADAASSSSVVAP